MKKFHTYILIDPENKLVRYVGATRNPKARFSAHLSTTSIYSTQAKREWISYLLSNNLLPIMEIVGTFDTKEEAANHEIELYHKYDKEQLYCINPQKHLYNPKPPKERVTVNVYISKFAMDVINSMCKSESRSKRLQITHILKKAHGATIDWRE
jgi:predicted GIY-YIG superfamily endonuclease